MNDQVLRLDNQLCFALYACTRKVNKAYKPFLDQLGITYTQYITLLVLWEQDHITVKELGNRLYLDSGTLTPLLKKLEAMELVKRVRDKDDERNVFITLTQKGKELKEKALEIPEKLFCSIGISPEAAIDLKEKLELLLDHLNR